MVVTDQETAVMYDAIQTEIEGYYMSKWHWYVDCIKNQFKESTVQLEKSRPYFEAKD